MAFFATQPLDDYLLPPIDDETEEPEGENVILPPQQVGVLVVESEQQQGILDYPLFHGCNVVGRKPPDGPGALEAEAERLRQWRSENLQLHVEGIFLPDPSISGAHAHI
ncbi:hypothetical protein Agub_g10170, partial [Astrephomene gubernaculifera]